jgi:lipopolysaccharide/colanic/teichoic acid biosynthesis glycosyltransferase
MPDCQKVSGTARASAPPPPSPKGRGASRCSEGAHAAGNHARAERSVAPVTTELVPAPSPPDLPELADTVNRLRDVPLLSEELFKSVLIRERKRADRFAQAFALVTVALPDGGGAQGSTLPLRVADALAAAARETDVVGWLQEGAVLGVTYAEVATRSETAAGHLEARLQRELRRVLDPDTRAGLRIRWYFHVPPGSGGIEGLADDDPLAEDLHRAQDRRTWLNRLKRALDIAGSSVLLVLLSPLFLLLGLLIRLTSSGPILFRQVRIGHLGRPFTMLKLRTMHAKANHGVHKQYVTDFIKGSMPSDHCGGERVFKIVNDPRVTGIGRVLRRTSLDELPQLWNVLRGDMSLVGPRPPLHYELEQYSPWHWRRVLEGKPGVTGLWQVTGRSRTTFDEMVRLDIRYVRTHSLWSDIRILLATPRAVVTGKGAC